MTMLTPVEVKLTGIDKLAQTIAIFNLFFGSGCLLSIPVAGKCRRSRVKVVKTLTNGELHVCIIHVHAVAMQRV